MPDINIKIQETIMTEIIEDKTIDDKTIEDNLIDKIEDNLKEIINVKKKALHKIKE